MRARVGGSVRIVRACGCEYEREGVYIYRPVCACVRASVLVGSA